MKKSIIIVSLFLIVFLISFAQPVDKYIVDAAKCISCTLCVQKCPVKAIEMVDGKAVIDIEKCIGCGICANVCPTKAIDKIETKKELEVKKEKITDDEEVKKEIKESKVKKYIVDADTCIGCQMCVPKCPVNAIEMIDGKAIIDIADCIGCGICADVCPVKAISN